MPSGVLTIEDFLFPEEQMEEIYTAETREIAAQSKKLAKTIKHIPENETRVKTENIALPPWEDPKLKTELSYWCFLFTAGKSGGHSGVHFMMSRCDAMRWCSSSISKGSIHGGEWAYFFISVYYYLFADFLRLPERCRNLEHNQKGLMVLDNGDFCDNGKWDKKIAAMGLKKYNWLEIRQILEPYGITIPMTPALRALEEKILTAPELRDK